MRQEGLVSVAKKSTSDALNDSVSLRERVAV